MGERTGGARKRGAQAARLAQLRALAHPLRLRLLELFTQGPRTAKQVAVALGLPPTRLYHHVAVLERAGLVRVRSTRRVRGAVEKYYEPVPTRDFRSEPSSWARRLSPADRNAVRLARPAATLVFERAREELQASFAHVGRSTRAGELPLLVRALLDLSPAHLHQVRRDLVRLLRRVRRMKSAAPSPSAGRDRWSLTMALLPRHDAPAASAARPARTRRRRRS
jgi:DNA-binding transcriptional ArsR family regulator